MRHHKSRLEVRCKRGPEVATQAGQGSGHEGADTGAWDGAEVRKSGFGKSSGSGWEIVRCDFVNAPLLGWDLHGWAPPRLCIMLCSICMMGRMPQGVIMIGTSACERCIMPIVAITCTQGALHQARRPHPLYASYTSPSSPVCIMLTDLITHAGCTSSPSHAYSALPPSPPRASKLVSPPRGRWAGPHRGACEGMGHPRRPQLAAQHVRDALCSSYPVPGPYSILTHALYRALCACAATVP